MNSKATWILGAGLVALAAVSAARADWLVTRDGGRFEIKGPWQVKGKLVVFTLPSGALSSLRVEQVDLGQSRTATAEAKAAATAAAEAPPAVEKTRRKSIISLTDKDFKKVPAPDATDKEKDKDGKEKGKEGKDGKDGGPKVATSTSGSVQVLNWDRVPPEKTRTDGLELTGTVANSGSSQVTDVQVMANLYDEVGTLIGKVPAQLANPILAPGESTTFTVAAPGLFAFTAIKFDIQSHGFKPKEAAPAPPANGAAAPPTAKAPR